MLTRWITPQGYAETQPSPGYQTFGAYTATKFWRSVRGRAAYLFRDD